MIRETLHPPPHHHHQCGSRKPLCREFCPAWKAAGNSTPVERGLPVQISLLRQLSHFHPPPGCFLFQRSEVWAPMRTPCWGSRSWAVPGASQAGVGLVPKAPAAVPHPVSRLHGSLHPSTTSSWQPARWLPGTRRGGNDPSQEAARLARPADSVAHQPGAQVSKERPTAHLPASSAKAWLPARPPGSQRPGQGLLPGAPSPLPRLRAALPGPRTARSHLGAARSGAGTPEEGVGGTAVT